MLLGCARGSGHEPPVDARAKLDRSAVGEHRHRLAGLDRPLLRVLGRELDHRLGPLELELRHALDRAAGEERAVAGQAELRRHRRLLRLHGGSPRRSL